VLFADLSGFTRLVETAEPEIVYERVRPLMDELVLLVHLYGGEVQQVLGDGFMSVFGLRSTIGDEAQRAVRAGLAMVGARGAARQAGLPVHVGIEHGEVLVTPDWEGAGFGVWGRPVNLAKRLCDIAGPGELQVGPAAFARAQDCLDTTMAMRTRLKGITRWIVAHRVGLGPTGPLLSGSSSPLWPDPPTVGRSGSAATRRPGTATLQPVPVLPGPMGYPAP
jgi:class 3 adenylate cyclase